MFFKEMNAPSFRVEKNTDGSMLLHYYSDRRGLCHIVPGDCFCNYTTEYMREFYHGVLCHWRIICFTFCGFIYAVVSYI